MLADHFAGASGVIGQADFDAFGESHWQVVCELSFKFFNWYFKGNRLRVNVPFLPMNRF